MWNRRPIGLDRGVAGLGPTRAVGVDAGHIILTSQNNGGSIQFTTAAPHGITGTPSVTVSGHSENFYNTNQAVTSVDSETTFTTEIFHIGDGTGGRWDYT